MSTEARPLEEIFDTLWTYKEKGYLDESIDILRRQGHHPQAVEFALRDDSYYFPNIVDGKVITPEGTRADKIAVIALSNGQTVSYDKPTLHFIQRTAVRARGEYSSWVIRDAERDFKEMGDTISGNGGSEGGASVVSRWAAVKDRPDLKVESKPAVIFNPENPATRFGAGVVIHELVHVAQTLSAPVRSREPLQCLRREFEATAVQAPPVRSFAEPFDDFNQTALLMDEFRLRYLGENNYQPDEFVMEAFKADGRFGRIVDSLH
jgi:hypothetical protein